MEQLANKLGCANIKMPTANKEYAWAVPKNCTWFALHVRDNTAIRIGVLPGHVASSEPPYFTLKSNALWNGEYFGIKVKSGVPLYFACASANKTIEILMGIHEPELDSE